MALHYRRNYRHHCKTPNFLFTGIAFIDWLIVSVIQSFIYTVSKIKLSRNKEMARRALWWEASGAPVALGHVRKITQQKRVALTWTSQWHVSPMIGKPMEPFGIGSLQFLSRVAVQRSCHSCWDTAIRSATEAKHAASVASADTRSKLPKSILRRVSEKAGVEFSLSLEWNVRCTDFF